MEPEYIVIGSHIEAGLLFELVVLRDDMDIVLGNGEPLWLHNPKVRVTVAPGAPPADPGTTLEGPMVH